MKMIEQENISIKIDYILGIEEWKDEGKTFFLGEFQTDDQELVVSGSWKFFFNTIEAHKKVYKGDYVKGRIFFLSHDDKNYESLLSKEKENQKSLNFRSIGKQHDSFEISSFKNGKEHGITILQDGSSLWVDSYLDGIKEGPHEEWVSDGDYDITLPHRIENFRNDKLEGLCKYFWDFCDQDGNPWPSNVVDQIFEKECLPLDRTINYKDGKKDGLVSLYQPWNFKRVSEEINYKKGKKEGTFKKFHYSDTTREPPLVSVKGKYKNNLLEGAVVEYYESGEIFRRSIFKKGISVSWTQFYKSLRISDKGRTLTDEQHKVIFKAGASWGIRLGDLESVEGDIGYFEDGKLRYEHKGLATKRYYKELGQYLTLMSSEDGNKEPIILDEQGNLYTGIFTRVIGHKWWVDTFTYKQGEANGKCTSYFEGKKSSQGDYLQGLREGVWENFNEGGKLESTIEFKKGKLL